MSLRFTRPQPIDQHEKESRLLSFTRLTHIHSDAILYSVRRSASRQPIGHPQGLLSYSKPRYGLNLVGSARGGFAEPDIEVTSDIVATFVLGLLGTVNLKGNISFTYECTWYQVGAKVDFRDQTRPNPTLGSPWCDWGGGKRELFRKTRLCGEITPSTIGFGKRLEIVRVTCESSMAAVGVTAEWDPEGISHGVDVRVKSRRHWRAFMLMRAIRDCGERGKGNVGRVRRVLESGDIQILPPKEPQFGSSTLDSACRGEHGASVRSTVRAAAQAELATDSRERYVCGSGAMGADTPWYRARHYLEPAAVSEDVEIRGISARSILECADVEKIRKRSGITKGGKGSRRRHEGNVRCADSPEALESSVLILPSSFCGALLRLNILLPTLSLIRPQPTRIHSPGISRPGTRTSLPYQTTGDKGLNFLDPPLRFSDLFIRDLLASAPAPAGLSLRNFRRPKRGITDRSGDSIQSLEALSERHYDLRSRKENAISSTTH
ncbi:hypothetical protein DFH07DRAFT_979845 [Mycena maculata]|uniref:Uncharacterized protein n=1 Tax=Mycena maculata TaxID=230809 RepID=A0AAD7IHC1_9AGAR|nr:hypothetical protein DFH07DRAFT_979845 [Mycena maculata]